MCVMQGADVSDAANARSGLSFIRGTSCSIYMHVFSLYVVFTHIYAYICIRNVYAYMFM